MNNDLMIHNLGQSITRNYNEISADVDGERVFFRVPLQYALACRAEPFLGIALLEAMIRNVNIRIEDSMTLSEKLYKMLPTIQTIYACWNSDLHKVNIHARTDSVKNTYERVSSFYSGGVDSSHTLYRNLDEITHLVLLSGFELAGNTPESWRQSVENQKVFALKLGKELTPIETNAKQWTDKRRIHWAFAQGLILSSIGPLLESKRIYIAASHTYNELFPWGSHPLTDPMWSTESTEVIHDGAGSRRGEKICDLCNNQMILDNLQVCWESPNNNCGKCQKCVRTMTALYLLGASSQALPKFDNNLAKLKSFKTTGKSGATFLEDAIIMAQNSHNQKVYRILRRYHRRYHMRQVLKILDRYMLGGLFRRIYRIYSRIRHPDSQNWRVYVLGSQDWAI